MTEKDIDKAKKKLSEMADDMTEEEALKNLAKRFNITPEELSRGVADAINKHCEEEQAEYGGGRISPEAAVVLDEIDDFLAKSEGKTQEEIDEGIQAIIRAHTPEI